MSYLVAVTCILNEAPYLKQWIDFHIIQGFEKFYIYNNHSTDNFRDVLSPYVNNGIVEIREVNDNAIPSKGIEIVNSTVAEFKGVHKWLFHHSIDEYMYSRDGLMVNEVLKQYEQYGGYILPWKFFNSDGHLYKTDDLVIERFHTWTDDFSRHIKTIIQPDKTRCCVGNPHSFYFNNGCFAVNENYMPQEYKNNAGATNASTYSMNRLVLNHYVTMSKEEFEIKMNKGRCDIKHLENVRRAGADQQWNDLHNINRKYYTCNDLDKYIPILKKM